MELGGELDLELEVKLIENLNEWACRQLELCEVELELELQVELDLKLPNTIVAQIT